MFFLSPWRRGIKRRRFLTLLVSICLHGALLLFLSFKADAVRPVKKETTPILSLFNIAEIEPRREAEPKTAPEKPPPADDAGEFAAAEKLPVVENPEPAESPPQPVVEAAEPEPPRDQAGGGTDQAAGIAENRPAAPVSRSGENERYIRQNYDYIQRRIRARLVYPAQARRAGVRGTAEAAFTILEDGSIDDLVIRKSSGFPVLDEAALESIRRAAPFKPPPAPARLAIPVVFTLR